jgi:competence protein ComFC
MITKNRALFKLKVSDLFPLKDRLFHLIFPEKCTACSAELSTSDRHLCPFCLLDLDYTYFEKYTEATAVEKLFWGRVPIEQAYAHLFYRKGGSTQQILHALKYTYNGQIGRAFGKSIGQSLRQQQKWMDVDVLVPVPIHPKKEFTRGYNQSALIAEGISESMGIPVQSLGLQKSTHTASQTRKGRFLRWENVQNNFSLSSQSDFTGKHIVFVDDVITTGATLESLIRTVLDKYPDIRISVISLAFAA